MTRSSWGLSENMPLESAPSFSFLLRRAFPGKASPFESSAYIGDVGLAGAPFPFLSSQSSAVLPIDGEDRQVAEILAALFSLSPFFSPSE